MHIPYARHDRLRCAKEVSAWFKSRLNPLYISIPSNPNLYSAKIIMKMRLQTIANSVSIRIISPTATPLPKAYDCVAVYIAGRRTNIVVYGCRPKPPTKKITTPKCHIWKASIFFEDVHHRFINKCSLVV